MWDLKDLGLQAVQRIFQASDPLRSLTDISQNFPNFAALLSRSKVDSGLRAEVKRNQELLPASELCLPRIGFKTVAKMNQISKLRIAGPPLGIDSPAYRNHLSGTRDQTSLFSLVSVKKLS